MEEIHKINENLYERDVSMFQINNLGSWIGVKDEVINIFQDYKNKFMLTFFASPK